MDITTGFEYLNEECDGQLSHEECGMKLLNSAQLQESTFTDLARFVAQQRQVRYDFPRTNEPND